MQFSFSKEFKFKKNEIEICNNDNSCPIFYTRKDYKIVICEVEFYVNSDKYLK